MERDSSKHSEFASTSADDETVLSTETDKKKRKKSQTDTEATWSKSKSAETKPEESKKKETESLETWWRRSSEESKQPDIEEDSESEESLTEDELDNLSQSEVKEVADAYLTARRQEIAQELTNQPDEVDSEVEAQAALAAETYLAAVENKLNSEPDLDIKDATNEAFAEAVRTYVPESFASINETDNDNETLAADQLDNSGNGDSGRQPPYWSRGSFPPGSGRPFEPTPTNNRSNLETIIERDFAAERVAAVRGLLVGGIIGYLIGRRRGRIKTEKRLIPVQKKLERQVEALYNTISVKETQLRKLVFERNHLPNPTKLETINNNAISIENSSENFPDRNKPSNVESLKTTKIDNGEKIYSPSSIVEVMNRDTLLEAGEKITIGSTTLRKVYETGLISERGLRRAVAEYSKGGDIRRVLAEEVLIKELGYELDPLLRDRPLKKSVEPKGVVSVAQPASHQQAVAELQGQSTLPSPDNRSPFPPPIPDTQRSVPSLLITANVIALIVLGILLFILLITHK